jgi:hypothetical protein
MSRLLNRFTLVINGRCEGGEVTREFATVGRSVKREVKQLSPTAGTDRQ